MIQAIELKLNNWVAYEGKYWQVDSLSNFPTIGITDGKEQLICNDINPIELSPDILEGCGFLLEEDSWYDKHGVRILFHDKGITVVFSSIVMPVQYLHVLQNLIFALTGTELKANL